MSVTIEPPRVSARSHAIIVSGSYPGGAKCPEGSQVPFALAIFLSAFLLFQVQLLLGKSILPLFGGAPAVWTACVLVFQLLFLAGYGYSHGLAMWLPVRRQVIVHGTLLGFSALLIAVHAYLRSVPIDFSANWQPGPGGDPTWAITKFLIGAIGLP